MMPQRALLEARRWRMGALAVALAGLCFAAMALQPDSAWGQFVGRLCVFPVLAAALWYGWRGGAACALAASLGLAVVYTQAQVPFSVQLLLEAALLLGTGIAVGAFAGRESRRAREYLRVVDELRAAHQELQENFEGMKRAERLFAVGQLSAGLAHEIRNPLASLSGAAGMLRRSPDATARQVELLEIIEKECQRLNRMLTSFLEFARPRTPQARLTAVEPILDGVIGLASHAIGRKKITLRKSIEPGVPEMHCDAEQLQQVLLNMVINAIQASEDGDSIVLQARVWQEKVWLDVRDEGCGVKPEHVDRLFDPFFTTKESGTGLGLPVAHEIVRSIGGVLKVTHNPERGMTFSVGLPMETSEGSGLSARPRTNGMEVDS
jgi:two-component system, NtrC family, sensor histidine kinase HydH